MKALKEFFGAFFCIGNPAESPENIMALNCGIVGLPNVGKSTIFSALTSAPAEAANYPFCTIDPNVGVVKTPDPVLDRIDALIEAEKKIPPILEFVDIAGLVKGASQGEGLGNQFLSHIREVGLIIHVVRCFNDADVTHVDGKVDPVSDIETIHTELALADLATIEKRREKLVRLTRGSDPKVRAESTNLLKLLDRITEPLSEGIPLAATEISTEESHSLADLHLITMKPRLYLCNIDDENGEESAIHVRKVEEFAQKEGADVLSLCGRLEADIAVIDDEEERKLFLEDAGLEESGLARLCRKAYHTLGLRTFYTVGGKENKGWTFPEGIRAPEAAGIIHTDFAKGFIKAEVYHCDDLFELGSEQKIRSEGCLRIEGKDYIVKDGDVMHFKFNTLK